MADRLKKYDSLYFRRNRDFCQFLSFTKGIESLLESRRRAREAREYCEQHNIPLSPEYETDNTAHISAQSPDSGPSEAYYSCLEVVQTYQKLAEKLFRWRPPAELNQKMAFAFKGEVEFYKPIIDDSSSNSTSSAATDNEEDSSAAAIVTPSDVPAVVTPPTTPPADDTTTTIDDDTTTTTPPADEEPNEGDDESESDTTEDSNEGGDSESESDSSEEESSSSEDSDGEEQSTT